MTDTEDFSALRAHHKIETHEKVCTERYGAVWSALQDIKRDMSSDRISRASADTVIHGRFNTMSNRMWVAMGGTAVAAILGLASLLILIISRGLK